MKQATVMKVIKSNLKLIFKPLQTTVPGKLREQKQGLSSSNKQSVTENIINYLRRKRATIQLPTETTRKSHESNVKIVHEKQREFRESEWKPLGSEETIQGQQMIGPRKKV